MERFKLCPISKCRACGYARYEANVGYVVPEKTLTVINHARIYRGCGKIDPVRPFDYGVNIFGPEEIPDWCPLPDAPEKKE